MIVEKLNFSFTASSLTDTKTIANNGFVDVIKLVTANFTNVVTSTVTIKDDNGDVIYTGSAIAKATTNVSAPSPHVPVGPGFTITVTLSGVAGGSGGTDNVSLFIVQW